MKWKPMQDRDPNAIVEWSLVVIMAPVLVPLVALVWIDSKTPKPSEKWHKWFAWRPVRAWSNPGVTTVWLETIERRGFYGTVDYRLIGTD